jgi:hypothetical protein
MHQHASRWELYLEPRHHMRSPMQCRILHAGLWRGEILLELLPELRRKQQPCVRARNVHADLCQGKHPQAVLRLLPTPLPPGAVWAGICDCVWVYYNSTMALCTARSHPQCRAGESAAECTKDADSTCEQCTDGPLNGPFEWTHGCAFSCSNATFYNENNNRTCSAQPTHQTTTTNSRLVGQPHRCSQNAQPPSPHEGALPSSFPVSCLVAA